MAISDFPFFKISSESPQQANRGWVFARRLLLAPAMVGIAARHTAAGPNTIENLTFFDRGPGSPRTNPFESVFRLDANDTSFAVNTFTTRKSPT